MDTKDVIKISDMLAEVVGGHGNRAESMTKFSKMTSVIGRAYVEEDVLAEDISGPLMAFTNQMYIGMVLTTLQLGNVIDNYDVVRSNLDRVATENYQIATEAIDTKFGVRKELVASMEADVLDLDKKVTALASSKLIEFDFIVNTKDGKATTIKVPINVSILPAPITRNVATAFLGLNFDTSFSARLTRFKAGEISFFSDLILSRDLVNRYSDAIKEDHTNVLKEMMDRKSTTHGKQIQSALGKISNNIASSILIFDKRTFENAVGESTTDFTNYAERQKFFSSSMALMVCVVDLNYKNIDIYFNGLQQHSSYPFRVIEKAGAAKDSLDIKTLMATLAKGNAPRF